MQIQISILRWDSRGDVSPYFEDYSITYSPGLTLLDALRFIQANFDPTLAFRWECRKATCGSCAVRLNDQPVLACQKNLDPQAKAMVKPLANFPVIKDLVIDLKPALERLTLVKPYLESGEGTIDSKAEADLSRNLRSCIECWACVSVCPVVYHHPCCNVADPVGMVQLARFALDKRDRLDRKALASKLGLDQYNCGDCQQCVEICPKEINIPQESIAILRSEL